MTAKGDAWRKRTYTKEYGDGWDVIFNKKKKCPICGKFYKREDAKKHEHKDSKK